MVNRQMEKDIKQTKYIRTIFSKTPFFARDFDFTHTLEMVSGFMIVVVEEFLEVVREVLRSICK